MTERDAKWFMNATGNFHLRVFELALSCETLSQLSQLGSEREIRGRFCYPSGSSMLGQPSCHNKDDAYAMRAVVLPFSHRFILRTEP